MRGIALCAIGVEKIVAQELEHLDLKPLERRPGQVFFALNEGNFARDLARANSLALLLTGIAFGLLFLVLRLNRRMAGVL